MKYPTLNLLLCTTFMVEVSSREIRLTYQPHIEPNIEFSSKPVSLLAAISVTGALTQRLPANVSVPPFGREQADGLGGVFGWS